jgi:hypothetical protein
MRLWLKDSERRPDPLPVRTDTTEPETAAPETAAPETAQPETAQEAVQVDVAPAVTGAVDVPAAPAVEAPVDADDRWAEPVEAPVKRVRKSRRASSASIAQPTEGEQPQQ